MSLLVHWRAGLGLLVALPLVALAVPQSLRWVGTTFPGFLLMENRVVASVGGYDWPPDKGRVFHARVVAVEGTAVVSRGDVYQRVATAPPGTAFRYALWKSGAQLEATIPSRMFTAGDWLQVYGMLLLVGLLNFGTAIAVTILQPANRAARVYFWTMLIGGFFATSAGVLHHPGFPRLSLGYFLTEGFFPAAFMHLAMVFPVDRLAEPRRRPWALVPYAIATVLTAAKLSGLETDPPALWALHATYLFIAAGFVFFVASAMQAYVTDRDPLVRPRLRVVLLGIVAGSVPSFTVFVDNAVAGGQIPMQFGVVLVPTFILAVAYAIAKHDLFDVDRIVRQGFIYGTLSVIVVAAYALVLLLPVRLIPDLAVQTRLPLSIAFVLVLALGLDRLRRLVQDAVDRAFYRARLNYRRTIAQLSESLTTLLEVSEVVAQVTRVVTESMQLESTSIALIEDDRSVLWIRDAEGRLIRRVGDRGLAALGLILTRPGGPVAARRDDPQLDPVMRETLVRYGAMLALALAVKERSLGLLMLGPRQSGRPFDAEDLALLRTLSHQAAIGLHNARSYEQLAKLTHDLDLRVREQTEELRNSHEQLRQAYHDLERAQAQLVHSEKMTSLGQLVAGVAHEINNPASFVHGSLANLTEYLESFIRTLETLERLAIADPALRRELETLRAQYRLDYLVRETPQLLRICAEGSERIRNIVADLRTFARAGGTERMATDVRDGLESTLRLLHYRLTEMRVRVIRDYQATPPVHASPAELNQAWMNLLANAIDAVAGLSYPEITVRTRTIGDPTERTWLEVEIADNGPGIAAEHFAHVFEPFFTTKPVGEGTGLGLSIAYGAVRSHGGEITLASTPGGGATFVVRLPVAGPERGGSRAAA